MLIVVDIGNSNIVIGLYKGPTLKDHVRMASRHSLTADEAGFFICGFLSQMNIANEQIESAVIGSVVPPLTSVFETTVKRYLGCIPVVVSARIDLPVRIDIDNPDEAGADRIANAVAGFAKFGGPIVIVDFGTATTFDVVNAEGTYVGGVIAPGPETGMLELVRRAARLFEVRIEKPDAVIGRSTAGALKSGLFYGTVGQVDFILDRILEEKGFSEATIVATGGLASGIEKQSRHTKLIEPTLTLEGLRLIGEYAS
ncbi:MAG: type III pantothenate kinase [Candidatus Zixiibacteriota bacterium]